MNCWHRICAVYRLRHEYDATAYNPHRLRAAGTRARPRTRGLGLVRALVVVEHVARGILRVARGKRQRRRGRE
jgi:hypothetical protein